MAEEITIEQLQAEAEQAELQLAVKREALRLKRLELSAGSDYQLAVQLHGLLAQHKPGACQWDYEMIDGAPDWTAPEHAAWLAFAQGMQTATAQMGGSASQILQMLGWVEQNRPR